MTYQRMSARKKEAMDPLDQQIDRKVAEALAEPVRTPRVGPARMLIVGRDDPDRRTILNILQSRRHQCTCAARLDEARSLVARHHFDVVLLSANLPDGNSLDLAPLVQKVSPATKTIVVSAPGGGSFETAVTALRHGVVDFIATPIDPSDFASRVDSAIIRSQVDQQREDRLARLKKVCQELNSARHEISEQVDSLCNDLVNAYQEIAEQMTEVAMSSEFRTLLKQELDVEDLLRTTLEYLLTKTGPTNAAVFLPDSSGSYNLGAYVNYDCPRQTIGVMLDHLCHAICPQMADEPDMVSFDDADEFAEWIGADAGFLAGSQVLAFSCRHKKDCLAVIVLFRNRSNAFGTAVGTAINTLRPIIAEQLANVIRVHHRARPSWPKEASGGGDADVDYNDDLGFGFEGGLAA
jgi:DNA-binding response OmpR family regulator